MPSLLRKLPPFYHLLAGLALAIAMNQVSAELSHESAQTQVRVTSILGLIK